MISLKPFFGYLAEHQISLKKASTMMGIKESSLYQTKFYNRISQSLLDRICSTFGLEIKDVIRYEED